MSQSIPGFCSRSWLSYLLPLSAKPNRVAHPFSVGFRAHALRPTRTRIPQEDDDDEGPAAEAAEGEESKKSRNEQKREARRAVKWGMELATFSPPQIKRVLRVASLEKEVFDAFILLKRFGPDVREGKRRQFNYIGRLLRDVQPELMDALIQASKDGDNSRLIALSGEETVPVDGDQVEEDITSEEEECGNHIELADRWFDGLIYKDSSITNEVYSIHNVEFDRQELRRLVRHVQTIQEESLVQEREAGNNSTVTVAKKPLVRLLRSLAKQSFTQDNVSSYSSPPLHPLTYVSKRRNKTKLCRSKEGKDSTRPHHIQNLDSASSVVIPENHNLTRI